MKDVVYVTGNPEKAQNFSKHIGLDVPHMSADVDEIQTLDTALLLKHKTQQAFDQIKRPVLVEDVELAFEALGGLPGPFIKFFVYAGMEGDIAAGVERLCRILDGLESRRAMARCTFGYFDGTTLTLFEGSIAGTIAAHPKGTGGFGFDRAFIPDGFEGKTAAELNQTNYDKYYSAIKPFQAVREFLNQ